jgi:hypothetical protein
MSARRIFLDGEQLTLYLSGRGQSRFRLDLGSSEAPPRTAEVGGWVGGVTDTWV